MVTEELGIRTNAGNVYGCNPVLSDSVQPARSTIPSPRFVRRTHSLFRFCRSSPGASNCVALISMDEALPICGKVRLNGVAGWVNEGFGTVISARMEGMVTFWEI